MSALALLRADLRSQAHHLFDRRARGLLALVALVDLALGAWGVRRAGAFLAAAESPGALAARLWLIAGTIGLAAAGLGLIAVLQQGFGDAARLLHTLPLPPAARARGLYGRAAVEAVNLWVLSLGIPAVAAALALGRAALPWIALWAAVAAAALAGTLAATLGVAGLRTARARGAALASLAAAAGIGELLAVRTAAGGSARMPALPHPGAAALAFAALVAVVLGPLAGPVGRLHERALRASEARAPRAGRRRLLRLLVRRLAGRRSPAAALLAKSLLARGRSGANWLRAAVLLAPLFFYPRLHAALAGRGLPGPLIVAGTVSVLLLVAILDGFASPLGAEGNRLALLLTAPLSAGGLLRAAAVAFLAPFLPLVLGATLLLGVWSALRPAELSLAALADVLILAGQSALFAWGSAWDADLELEIEPGLRGLLREEIPLTPPRLLLVAAGAALLAGDLALLHALPGPFGLAALAAWNALAATAAWRLGLAGLRRLGRAG